MTSLALLIGGPGDGETLGGLDEGAQYIKWGDQVYVVSPMAKEYYPGFDGLVFLHPSVVVCGQSVRVLKSELSRSDPGEEGFMALLRREVDRHPIKGRAVGTSVLDRREDQESVDFTLRWLAVQQCTAEVERDGAAFRQ